MHGEGGADLQTEVLWRTPGAEDGGRRGEYATYEAYKARIERGGQINLAHQEKFPELWPTPNTMDCLPARTGETMERMYASARKGRSAPSNLREQMHPECYPENWATPTAQDAKNATLPPSQATRDSLPGNALAETWATPAASDGKGTSGGKMERSLRTDTQAAGTALNPEWVELLMGLPVGWTSPAGQQGGAPTSTHGSRRGRSRPGHTRPRNETSG